MVHQYKLRGYNIVLDVFSGSVHVVDDLAYDIIGRYETADRETIVRDMLEKYAGHPEVTREEIEDIFADLEELRGKGKLFVPDVYAGHALDLKARHTEIKALCLHVAHTCNLNCSYCFAAQGNYHGERALMTFEVGKRALDFLMENSGSRRNLEVDFFGGEPLMNWEVCKQLVRYARSVEEERGKHFRFTLTTNGMLLNDDVVSFCNAEMDNVVLSLDGRKEIHDYWRKTPSGKGSYDVIVPKFRAFVREREKTGKSYYMRGTYTGRNPDFLRDILHMADLGFRELSMEPVVCDPSEPYALKEEDLPFLKEQYEELAVEMIRRKQAGNGFTFYHYMIDLTGGPCIYKRISGCGSGTEYLAVTPAGDLYPCHQFVGDPHFRMGDIWEGVTNTDLRDSFKLCNAYAREECKDCWAKLYCSGGCAANAYHATGDIRGVYAFGCDLFRKRMECAILLKLAEQGIGPLGEKGE